VILAFFGQDIRYAFRLLLDSRVFTLVAASSLALGIGANTAIFTLVDAILLRSLPVQNPQQLVLLARNPSQPTTASNYPDYLYIRDHSRSYTGLIALSSGSITTFDQPGRNSTPQVIALALVSGNYFDVLGVPPALGRVFNSADNVTPGAHPYVVLSHNFWKRAFGANTSVIGRDIILNGARLQVVGVAREGFAGTNVGVAPDVFAPIVMERTFWRNQTQALTTRNTGWVTIMGRLKPGVRRNQAEAELNVLWRQILSSNPEQSPTGDKSWNTCLLLPGSAGASYLRNQVSRPITILIIASGFVLLIACANVANLLLGRSLVRRKEIAVRVAVGARRSRLVVQMLTESLGLSAIGGVAALILAWLGLRLLLTFLPNGALSPVELNLSPDGRLLGFTFALTMLTGIAFGLTPALRASRQDPLPALRSASTASHVGGAARWDIGRTLVALQVAISLVLLSGASLFARTLANLRSVDLGLNHENILLVDTNMVQTDYQPQQARLFFDRLRQYVQRLPGVRAASMAAIGPFGENGRSSAQVQIEGYSWKPDEQRMVYTNAVTPRYFEAAGIPMLQGRDFQESDSAAVFPDLPAQPVARPLPSPGPPRVAIVNEAFARHFFPGRSALGNRVCLGEKWDPADEFQIIGLVGDTHYYSLRQAVAPMIYRPLYRDMDWSGGILCIRTDSDPHSIIGAIRRRVHELDSILTVTEARTMEDNFSRALAPERFVATLGGFFGAVALILAAIGLYGVMAQAVTRRTREIGIRMALGAEPGNVLWMVLRESLVMVAIGALAGLPAAMTLTRYTASLLYGVKPQDPFSISVAVLLLLAFTGFAGFLPAHRATRVQPMEVLRQE
jgi:predicted permease